MRHFGLIGKSLSHSFSAKFFGGKFKAEQIDADYNLFEIESIDMLPSLVEERKLDGFNVTIPYKESVIPYLDELSEEAEAVGAVNCVVVRDGKMIGHNTDITGIEASLHWLDIADGEKALVLGTGGASKAVQYVLRKGGAEVKVVSRTEGVADLTYNDLSEECIAECDIIVNTTPLGMFPNVDSAPTLPYSALSAKHTLFDCVYNPRQTKFLQLGAERGARTIDGLTMFHAQAEASWEIWND